MQNKYNFEILYPDEIPKEYNYIDFKHVEGLKASCFEKSGREIFILEPDNLQNATTVAKFNGENFLDLEWLITSFAKDIVLSLPIIIGNIVGEVSMQYVRKEGRIDVDFIIQNEVKKYRTDLEIIGRDKAFKELKKYSSQVHNNLEDELVREIGRQAAIILTFFPENKLRDILCEVELISPKYGLRGRVDFQYCYGSEDGYMGKSNLMELKSSKPPRADDGFWESHGKQVICYALMAETMHKRVGGQVGVLYSRGTPVYRQVHSTIDDIVDIVHARNKIVYNSLLVANGNLGVIFDSAKKDLGERLPPFLKAGLSKIKKVLRTEERIDDSLVCEIEDRVGFLQREIDAGYKGFASVWREPLQKRLASGEAISRATLKSLKENIAVFKIINHTSGIREGSKVLIMEQDGDSVSKGLLSPCFTGYVSNINSHEIEVYTTNNLKGLVDDKSYALQEDFSATGANNCQAAVFDFFASGSRKVSVFLGNTRPAQKESVVKYTSLDGLNKCQLSSLEKSVRVKDYALIQGPPGSGKTQLISSMLRELVDSGETILLSGFTNTSVDNALERFKVNNESYKNLVVRLDGSRINSSYKDLVNSKIVGCTAYSAQFNKLFQAKKITCAVIDEASQLLDEHVLYIISKVDKVIFIGDQMQLPPIIRQNEGRGYDYSSSIFERLINFSIKNRYNHVYEVLNEQYRMTPSISDWVSNQFYNGSLVSKVKHQEGDGLYFYSSSGKNVGKINKIEAEEVVKYIEVLLDEGFNAKNIGVGAPFRAQCSFLKGLLANIGQEDIEVDTVERYQGREKEVMIFSTTASDIDTLSMLVPRKDGDLDKKLNVAVSRAKRRFVLFGKNNVLKTRREYKSLLESSINIDAII